jgi:tRNA A-37 threonylcarbamoyl transferase component Bud32
MFIKVVSCKTSENEIELQNVAARYGFCPKVIHSTVFEDQCFLFMEDLEEEPVGNVYGEDPSKIPKWIWEEMRRMITFLLEEECIEYRDINPYNFIEKDNRVYMIDFGDAKYTDGELDWFVQEFIDGENSWNPDYK